MPLFSIMAISTYAVCGHGIGHDKRLLSPETAIMENNNFVEKIASGLSQSATVKNVYGEPIQAGNKTIVPVAKIAYGFGGGYGKGNGKPGSAPTIPGTEKTPAGEGAGSGGGLYATPKGVYEITPAGTTFIPANSKAQLLTGIVIGFVIKALFFSHRK